MGNRNEFEATLGKQVPRGWIVNFKTSPSRAVEVPLNRICQSLTAWAAFPIFYTFWCDALNVFLNRYAWLH